MGKDGCSVSATISKRGPRTLWGGDMESETHGGDLARDRSLREVRRGTILSTMRLDDSTKKVGQRETRCRI